MAEAENQTFYSTSEVAARYHVTERAVRHWLKQGLLSGAIKKSPSRKSEWMIPESALEEFDEARRAVSEPD